MACHAGGRGFESRPLRHMKKNARDILLGMSRAFFLYSCYGRVRSRDVSMKC